MTDLLGPGPGSAMLVINAVLSEVMAPLQRASRGPPEGLTLPSSFIFYQLVSKPTHIVGLIGPC